MAPHFYGFYMHVHIRFKVEGLSGSGIASPVVETREIASEEGPFVQILVYIT